MGGGIKNTNNSITLNIKNKNYDVQPLSLFQLGTSGGSVPLGLGGSGETTAQNFNMVQDAPSPNNAGFVVGDFFTYTGGTPDGSNIICPNAMDFAIDLSNGYSTGLSGAIAPNENLNSINSRLETDSQFSPLNSLAFYGITLTLVANIKNGVLIGMTFYSTHEGVYIDSVRLDRGGASPDFTISFNEAYTNQTSGTATPNNVMVSAPNGSATSQPTYSEINQAQNGSVFDITSMSIEVKDVGVDNQIPQLLQPITFSNVDVDGNEQQKAVVPTIDPNQIQNTLGDIQLGDNGNGVNYQLDGETALQLNLEGLANFNLTLNYVQLPNLVAGTEFGVQQAMEEQAQMQQQAQDNNYKRKIKLSKKSVKALKEDVKKKKLYLLPQDLPSFQTMCGYSLEYSLLPMY